MRKYFKPNPKVKVSLCTKKNKIRCDYCSAEMGDDNNSNYHVERLYDKKKLKFCGFMCFNSFSDGNCSNFEISNCSICSKVIGRNVDSLFCEICHFWTHRKCLANVSAKDYETLRDNDSDWYCPPCQRNIIPFYSLDDVDFLMMCNEQLYNLSPDIKQTCKKLMSLDFNVFHEKMDKSNSEVHTEIEDIDPDKYLGFSDNCKYTIDMNTEVECHSNSELSLVHFNIRSLPTNHEPLAVYLSEIKFKFDIIAVSETWLDTKHNNKDYDLDGYTLSHIQNRESKIGGGVLFYVRNGLTSKIVNNLCFKDDYNNVMTICVTKNSKRVFITACYRSPSKENNTFLPNFTNIISSIGNTDSIVCGDFNYNLLNMQFHSATEEYYNHMLANSYHPLISKPTRITSIMVWLPMYIYNLACIQLCIHQ